MSDIWFISDTHFQHAGILTFKDVNGDPVRTFSSVEEMDEHMVERWNSVVKPGDKIYHLGDVFFGSKQTFIPLWKRLNGKKVLILGNHDDALFFATNALVQKIVVWRTFPQFGIIATHIPLHEGSCFQHRANIEALNVHGHLHEKPNPSPRHRNISVERINYTPINVEELRIL
jgi:calcineurin-like phosphoesterase family protein